jgi:hypothetical protein
VSEYFVFSNSFAAPFFSDSATQFVEGDTPKSALEQFVKDYGHPAGLYFAALYASAEDFHKNRPTLVTWACNHEMELKRRTKGLGSYSFLGQGPGDFVLNGEHVSVENPKEGAFST